MINTNKYDQYGFPRNREDILAITIHEINMLSSQYAYDYYNNECKENRCYHYIVDSDESIQVIPDEYGTYHTDNMYSWANKYSISIALCSNINEDKFNSTVGNTVALIKYLQDNYKIQNGNIFFHIDFNQNTHCPNQLINKYGSSKRFVIEEIESEE